MFGNAFTGWHALILLAIILLLFGAPKLPALARSLGQSMKIFKSEIKQPTDETGKSAAEQASDEQRPSDELPSGPDSPTKP